MNLLLAAVLLTQDKAAEETFKKIEERIEKAKTISVKFEFRDPDRQVQGSGLLLVKDNRKLKLEYQAQVLVGGQVRGGKSTLVCDGQTTFRIEAGGRRAVEISGIAGVPISRSGISRFMAALNDLGSRQGESVDQERPLHPSAPEKRLDFAQAFEVKGVARGADDEGVKTLTYFLREMGRSQAYTVRVWYDANTFLIKKRTVTGKMGFDAKGPETIVTETYDEFTLNADIPDEKFKLPEEKN